jgi:hypothetical protein
MIVVPTATKIKLFAYTMQQEAEKGAIKQAGFNIYF